MTSPSVTPRPFFKWAGGKRALLPALLPLIPRSFNTYYEPFLGGGALFFALSGQRPWKRAVLADVNEDLVRAYTAIRDQPAAVIEALQALAPSREVFLRERTLEPSSLGDARRAARFIYLLKTGFNGLYRVNREGRFNVPWGKRPNVRVCDPERLLLASRALAGVELRVGDFQTTLRDAGAGDVIYADPPYVPIAPTSFVDYARGGFTISDHHRLAAELERLGTEGSHVITTNADCTAVRTIYRSLSRVRSIPVARPIAASVASRPRGITRELVLSSAA